MNTENEVYVVKVNSENECHEPSEIVGVALTLEDAQRLAQNHCLGKIGEDLGYSYNYKKCKPYIPKEFLHIEKVGKSHLLWEDGGKPHLLWEKMDWETKEKFLKNVGVRFTFDMERFKQWGEVTYLTYESKFIEDTFRYEICKVQIFES